MKMLLVLTGIMVSACCLFQPALRADDSAAGSAAVEAQATKVIVGILTVSKNDEDAVTGANITDENGAVYQIVLDENGKKLAQEMDDKKVAVTGVVNLKEMKVEDDDGNIEKQTELWLTVKSFKAEEEKAQEAGNDSDE